MRDKIAKTTFIIAAIALVSGATILALATPGSTDNPFITMRYLETVFRPQIISEISSTEKELAESFEMKIAELEARLAQDEIGIIQTPDSTDRFSVVTLAYGQTMSCSVGVEIMLRIGTATGKGSEPALVNYTNGETLLDEEALLVNHMYLVTIESNGIRATSDTVRVLVRGNYSIS